jgi:hypothetical protein
MFHRDCAGHRADAAFGLSWHVLAIFSSEADPYHPVLEMMEYRSRERVSELVGELDQELALKESSVRDACGGLKRERP